MVFTWIDTDQGILGLPPLGSNSEKRQNIKLELVFTPRSKIDDELSKIYWSIID